MQSDKGVHLFKRVEVIKVAKERHPNIEIEDNEQDIEFIVKIFALFDAQKTLPQIVQELKVHPKVVRKWFSEYSTTLEEGLDEEIQAEDKVMRDKKNNVR